MDDVPITDGESFQNGVYYPTTPKERVEAEVTQAVIKASSYPVMEDVAEWFKDAIFSCSAISNIQITTMDVNGIKYDRKTSVEAQVLAYQLLETMLTNKFDEFREFAKDES